MLDCKEQQRQQQQKGWVTEGDKNGDLKSVPPITKTICGKNKDELPVTFPFSYCLSAATKMWNVQLRVNVNLYSLMMTGRVLTHVLFH